GDFIQRLIKEIYCRLDRNSKTYKGKNRCKNKNAKIIQVFDGKKIRDTAQEILKEKGIYSAELVEYIHDHFGHPLGKNPGDVLIERSDKRAVLSKKQKLHTFYSHSKRGAKFNNPLGKNPGDVILTKHDLAVNRVGNFTYADPLHAKAYNIKGKNSGDVAKYPPHEPRHFQLLQMGIQHGGNTGKTIRHDHLLGKNPGDFWTITVKPFPGAHFAVYPQEICIKPIKASCPEFVCKKCGKPIMNKTSGTKGFGDSFNIRVRDMQIQPEKWGSLYKASEEEKKKYNEREYRHKNTRQKDIIKCDCNAGFEPGIVLDIFAGSGTTGAVAKKLGRRYILIELKPEYCKMARKRLKNA
ncbi:MAG: DNA methyltransferase, partial [Candidatus Hodarchaeota archaeon]